MSSFCCAKLLLFKRLLTDNCHFNFHDLHFLQYGGGHKLSKKINLSRKISWYRISGIFRVGLIFAELATSLISPKIATAKIKPYYTSSLRVFEIAKIWLSENLTHLQSVIFAKISRREKFPIYGIWYICKLHVINATCRFNIQFFAMTVNLPTTLAHECILQEADNNFWNL